MSIEPNQDVHGRVAIIGMAGRFPGAADVTQFWRNVCGGVEAITRFTDAELRAAGVSSAELADPRYVKAGMVLDGIDRFDAGFFGLTPREAQLIDPQQRLFLESAWAALEAAACDPERFDGSIGVFAGSALSTYLLKNLAGNPEVQRNASEMQVALGNDKDSLATTAAYTFDLRGPAYNIQSYCSTSLVAVAGACTSLVSGECDVALAGGAAISVPQRVGYLYQEGGIASPDGSCRAFDARAKGAPLGNGVGVVVLKRLEDALDDGDHIHAVIRGWAVNNDGALKVGYTAPGVRGQADVIAEAIANAEVDPASIGYVEAHGTGTALGDAAEFAALQRAFAEVPAGARTALGSVKTNVGHLDRAAGVTGLIKTALSIEHGVLPPTLHFQQANPQIDLAGSPFEVQRELEPWTAAPRRAGVSAFGIGGTNAHVVLEEAPAPRTGETLERPRLIVLSGRNDAAVEARAAELAEHLKAGADLADVAYTLQTGRRAFEHRRVLLATDAEDAVQGLRDPARLLRGPAVADGRPLAMLLAGVGEQYPGLAADLYEHEPRFREIVDECAAVVDPLIGADLRDLLFSDPTAGGPDLRSMLGRAGAACSASRLAATAVAQPAVFVVEYALARVLEGWGMRPEALAGYSLGEYVAATLAGVLSLEDALRLVVHRAQLIDALPSGAMVAVSLSPDEAAAIAGPELDIAAINGPRMCVVAGARGAAAAFERRLLERDVAFMRLDTTHAFHSRMLAGIAGELTAWVREHVTLSAPATPYVSNVTGTWITDDEATDPAYWARHMCEPVRFADMIETLLASPDRMLVEIGAGQSLGAFVRQHPACGRERMALNVATLPGRHERVGALETVHAAIGRLWLAGVQIDWEAYHGAQRRRRVPLPTYPFQRESYWIEPSAPVAPTREAAPSTKLALDEWFQVPRWDESDAPEPASDGPLLVLGDVPIEGAVRVLAGDAYAELAPDLYTVRPGSSEDFERLAQRLDPLPATVAHLWNHTGVEDDPGALVRHRVAALDTLVALTRAWIGRGVERLAITAFSDHTHDVDGSETLAPGKAAVLGACLVLGQEYPGVVTCRSVDLPAADAGTILRELAASELVVAHRGGRRLTRSFVPAAAAGEPVMLRDGGVYLITGGLGNVGLLLAEHLARRADGAKLVLTGRRGTVDTHKLRALEALGAEVLALAADEHTMGAAVATARERFGTIHGVIHAAGLTAVEAFQPVELMDAGTIAAHYAAKVESLAALDRALGDAPLDFCVLQSSMSAVLGGLGFAAYAAANAALDAYAARRSREGARWISVDWDTWAPTAEQVEAGASMAEFSMTVEEGLEAFDRALATPAAQVVVSTGNLAGRLDQWVNPSGACPLAGAAVFPRPRLAEAYVAAASRHERRLAELWREVLGLDQVGVNDNFFDLGGNSLMGLQLIRRVGEEYGKHLPAVALFESPTIAALARHLADDGEEAEAAPSALELRREAARTGAQTDDIAIIGMAGRFPGARDIGEFWRNLRAGVESIRFFSDEELLAAGVPRDVLAQDNYVKARPVMDGVDRFDAEFFGYSPREAELTDPQHRVFLEASWSALEDAGYAPRSFPGSIGVFAGTNISTYLRGLYEAGALDEGSDYQAVIGNDKDALTTTVSYRLDLTGPSMAVQTFCSTSLVALHLAARALASGECDMALAGGVSIRVPDVKGHVYTPGGMESPDGHVRTFDKDSRGSMFGDGAAIVVLKRLADAIADGDTVRAVIKGSAVNNDGSLKVGFTAPSVAGQSEVVTSALRASGVAPETISYVEAHGTGTPLGDPIELAALTRAFGDAPERGSCPIGSVKTNVGHLDRAAGVSGLIKTVLAMEHGELPPTLHYTAPNPQIDFENSPFRVNAELTPWTPPAGLPRRAGINSLGMGGTNVHVVLEEAPPAERTAPGRAHQLLLLSARTDAALAEAAANLDRHLREHRYDPANVAYTLQTGRERFRHRRALLGDGSVIGSAEEEREQRAVAIAFGDAPAVSPGLAAQLYDDEPAYRAAVDALDAGEPAAFVTQYAWAHLLAAWGVRAEAYGGEGEGDRVAARLAGEQALDVALLGEEDRLVIEPPQATDAAALHASIGELWLAGVELDWDAYHGGARRRVPLPTYPFQRERYWIEAPKTAVKRAVAVDESDPRVALTSLPRTELDEWLFVPTWQQALPAAGVATNGAPWLVFMDDAGVGDALVARLGEAHVTRVRAGDAFAQAGEREYVIRPGSRDDHARLLREQDVAPRHIAHLWTVDAPSHERSYLSLVWLAQALGERDERCDLLVATCGAHNVGGLDPIRPEAALVTGPCRVIGLELTNVVARHVDLDAGDPDAAVHLLSELGAPEADALVAWRGGRRWRPAFEPMPASSARNGHYPLKRGGVYLITGGLGGIGLGLAQRLARDAQAKLVLVGRSALPPRDEWSALAATPDAPADVVRRIKAIRALEASGAEVLVIAADVADADAMRAAVTDALARFGHIDGVLHAAGTPGMGLLQFRTPETAAAAMAPKVAGTRALLDALQDVTPDFVALFSSITSVTGGGPGQVDYCSANAYLDAVAQRADHGLRLLSIGWGEWEWNAWDAGLSGYRPEVREFFEQNRRTFGIGFDEGYEAFLRALAAGQPHVIISTQDFREIARLASRFTIETVLGSSRDPERLHERPDLGIPYVAPEGEVQTTIAELWAEALGLREVGAQDNFFELGGNSLLGVDLMARMCRRLGRDPLPPHVLYLAPTVSALAEVAGGTETQEWADDRRDRGSARRAGVRNRRRTR